jgi:transcriptional regulator with XRE-family HTH domain
MSGVVSVLWSAPVELPATDRMGYWLGRAARSYREEAKVVRSQIAGAVAIDQSTVARFEAGQSWPRPLDEMLAAYATLSGLEDVRVIWARALQLWEAAREPGVATAAGEALESMTSEISEQRRGKDPRGTSRGTRGGARKKAAG